MNSFTAITPHPITVGNPTPPSPPTLDPRPYTPPSHSLPHILTGHSINGAGEWGRQDESGRTVLPPRAPLTRDYMSAAGVYLMDNGRMLILWVGSKAPPELLSQVSS